MTEKEEWQLLLVIPGVWTLKSALWAHRSVAISQAQRVIQDVICTEKLPAVHLV